MNILVYVLIGAITGYAGVKTIQRMQNGSGCCGEHEKIKAFRKKAEHDYTQEIILHINGMTCENCAAKISNALNETDGVSASVSYAKKQAVIHCREDITVTSIRQVIVKLGYGTDLC